MKQVNTYISLLRGINVSGQKKIRMEELKELYESLGYSSVTTYIQSGNVVFDACGRGLDGQIEASIKNHFGYSVPVLVRGKEEFRTILDNNPFINDRNEDISSLHVVFLSQQPDPAVLEKLAQVESGADEYYVKGSEIYLYCPNGYGRTKLSNTVIEKKLQLKATTRNWKTVNKLYEIALST